MSVGLATFYHCFASVFLPIYNPCVLRGAAALDPKFAKFNCGLVTTAGMFGFIFGSYMVAIITRDQTVEEWEILLGIMTGLFLVSWGCYVVIDFAKGDFRLQKSNAIEMMQKDQH